MSYSLPVQVPLQPVSTTASHATRHMVFCRWLGNQHPGMCRLQGSTLDPRAGLHTYKLTVTTGTARNAGTEADVWVDIHGAQAESGPRQLASSSPTAFSRGSSDTFEMPLQPLGPLRELRIWHTGQQPVDAWWLELVVIQHVPSGQR